MKFIQIAILFSAIVLLSGCTQISRLTKSAKSNDKTTRTEKQQASNDIPFITDRARTEKTESTATKPKTEKTKEHSLTAEEVAKAPKYEAPTREKIVFAPNETEHIRIANHNPFESDNKIELSLESLSNEFCYPYPGKVISKYGYRGRSMHTGVDIKAIPNDTIRAAFAGVVRMAKPYSGYGNVIVVRHYNGLESVYSHNAKNLVTPNDVVEAGTAIALAGRTGRATTEHLHFELRVKGEHFDPTLLLDTDNQTINNGSLVMSLRNDKVLVKHSGDKNNFSDLSDNTPVKSSESESTPAPTTTTKPTSNSTTSTSTRPTSSTAPTTSNSDSKTVTIKKGDTLYKIARSNGTTVAKICKLNNISENKILSLGEKIKVK